MERLTKYICDRAHGAEGVSVDRLTGAYCRGKSEATTVVERLAVIEDILGEDYDLDRLRGLIEAYKLIGKEVYFPKDKVYGVVKETRTNGDFFWCYIYVGQGGFSLPVEYVKKFMVGEDKHEIFEPSRRIV